MLRHTIKYADLDNGRETVAYASFATAHTALCNEDELAVTFYCVDDVPFDIGQALGVTSDFVYYCEPIAAYTSVSEYEKVKVVRVNHADRNFTVKIPRYKTAQVQEITEYEEEGVAYWDLVFDGPHYFSEGEENISVRLNVSAALWAQLFDLQYVDYKTLRWVYDPNIPNFAKICEYIFPTTTTYADNSTSRMSAVTVTRDQTLFQEDSESEAYDTTASKPVLTYARTSFAIPVAIQVRNDAVLLKEDNLNTHFVRDEMARAVNPIPEMEKHAYTPVVATADGARYAYADILKINFNLHMRERSGDNWTVKEGDRWCFSKLLPPQYEPFRPYVFDEGSQSDLLGCLGFTNKDVKYQKNVLKKSFLRLSYYDSMNEADQHLLAYSVVYFDTASLYSKYMYTSDMPIYIKYGADADLGNLDVYKGGRVDTEVWYDELSKLVSLPTNPMARDEEIERYRISSRLSVENRWVSGRTSEGYYVYLWADNDGGIVPSDLFLKVELNHAGYGRTIPFMLPYRDGPQHGIKRCDEVDADNGYGVRRYKRYSYIRLKYCYDKENGRHVYYLDPEYYGNLYNNQNILNINLYEAKVRFDD